MISNHFFRKSVIHAFVETLTPKLRAAQGQGRVDAVVMHQDLFEVVKEALTHEGYKNQEPELFGFKVRGSRNVDPEELMVLCDGKRQRW